MHINRKNEDSAKAWALRLCIGPSMMVDGLVHFTSLGYLSVGLSLSTARLLAIERFRNIR